MMLHDDVSKWHMGMNIGYFIKYGSRVEEIPHFRVSGWTNSIFHLKITLPKAPNSRH